MGQYESAADARKKFGHVVDDAPASPAGPGGTVPDFTYGEYFEIGRGTSPGAGGDGSVRRGNIYTVGGGIAKAALAWEFYKAGRSRTGRLVYCAELVDGDVRHTLNNWVPIGSGGFTVIQQLLAGPNNAAEVLSVAGLIAELNKKVDKTIPAPNAGLSASNAVRRFGSPTGTTLTYAVQFTQNPITGISLNGVVRPVVQTGGASVNANTAPNTDTNYSLVVTTGTETTSVGASVVYRHERFVFTTATDLFGATDADITAFILALPGGEFATDRQQARNFALGSEFVYFYWPASFGFGAFIQNGLPNSAWLTKDFQFTNAAGYAESGRLTRSLSKQGGTQSITVN